MGTAVLVCTIAADRCHTLCKQVRKYIAPSYRKSMLTGLAKARSVVVYCAKKDAHAAETVRELATQREPANIEMSRLCLRLVNFATRDNSYTMPSKLTL